MGLMPSAFLIISGLLLLLGTSCASLRREPASMGELKRKEDLISLAAAVELARAAYNAGCVRTYNQKGTKGQYGSCLQAANRYIQDEVIHILNADSVPSKSP